MVTLPSGDKTYTESVYYYDKREDGLGFYDECGNYVSDTKAISPFLGAVSEALGRLHLGPEGAATIDFLMGHKNTVTIASSSGGNNGGPSGVLWNPNNLGNNIPQQGGGKTRSAFIGLGHELAHTEDHWKGTFNGGIWISSDITKTDPIYSGEIFSTHKENLFRAEQGIPLRTHYAYNSDNDPDDNTPILRTGTNQSMYVLTNGAINTNGKGEYKQVPRKQASFNYKK